MGKIEKPTLLTADHQIEDFDCGIETLNEWFIKRSMKNQKEGGSRTFVILDEGKVVGYYALASGSVERIQAPKAIARNMPEPIPVIVLGRLAIDLQYQSKNLGSALLKDAIMRTLNVATNIGIRSLLVHAISEDAKKFYEKYGFQVSPMEPMTLFLSIKQIHKIL
ncbi:GNAT family N-acetyltransferase [Marinicella sp. W31]|uniref:GNAT family N-acetyltransferase n=1 Tax=Marinicella sp. W31 TaxID=3023713 RepID=UPI0037583F22